MFEDALDCEKALFMDDGLLRASGSDIEVVMDNIQIPWIVLENGERQME